MQNSSGNYIISVARVVISWCKINLGPSKYSDTTRLRLRSHRGLKTYYGMYSGDCSSWAPPIIYINPDWANTFELAVTTTLHEYAHHLQDMIEYDRATKLYPYVDNPFEIEAVSVTDLHTSACTEWVRKELSTSV